MSTAKAWKCEVCGYVHEGPEPPETCPVCGVEKDLFSLFQIAAPTTAPSSAKAWRCTICGYVHEGDSPPDSCPICAVEADLFEPQEESKDEASASDAGDRIVIVGAGIAGVTAAAKARQTAPHAAVTLISKEPGFPYYRLNLSRNLAGEVPEANLALHPESWFKDQRIELVAGECTSIDRASKKLTLRDDRQIPYDRLILANGSHPFVPPLGGVTRQGVHTFRTLEDTRAILRESTSGTRCICIGGGLLGLEAAAALLRRGCQVTVLEGFGYLLPRQLSEPAAKLLQKHLEAMGLEIRCGVRVKELVGDEEVRAVRLESGEEIAGELVVLATGVRSNSHIARRSQLEVRGGVVVNDRMETSDPEVYAAGDVAEHDGALYGIWPVSYAQGAVAGVNAAGGNAEYHGMPPSNQLKVVDVDVVSIGQIQPSDGSYRIHEQESVGRYLRLVCRDGRLVGAVLYGDTSHASAIRDAVETGVHLRELPDLLKKLPALETLCGGAG